MRLVGSPSWLFVNVHSFCHKWSGLHGLAQILLRQPSQICPTPLGPPSQTRPQPRGHKPTAEELETDSAPNRTNLDPLEVLSRSFSGVVFVVVVHVDVSPAGLVDSPGVHHRAHEREHLGPDPL